jgi:hypothetical protein
MTPPPHAAARLSWPMLLLLVAALPAPLSAQEVRGVVSDVETGAPVAGAMVLLLDTAEVPATRVLTADDGSFHLTAPQPGRYHLRIDRIGYASTSTDPFDLSPGRSLVRDIATGVEPIELEGIDVEGAPRCQVRPAEGLATSRVWEEARKALSAAAWTSEREMYRFAWMRYVREVAPDGRRVLDERRTYQRRFTPQPFSSVPAEILAREGFVRRDGRDRVYDAPDAAVLLSDAFLDTHCFSLRGGKEGEGLIGLRFEPVGGRRLPEVEGVIWLERRTARLTSVDYGYVNLGRTLDAEDAGGEIVFAGLPNGTWVVKEWRIRMPRLEERRGAGGAVRYHVLGYRDEGGQVRSIATADGRVVQDDEHAAGVTGVVTDSAGRPAPGARVWIQGADREARTGEDGTFAFPDLGVGTWRVGATTPRLETFGHGGTTAEVDVAAGTAPEVRLALPSVRSLALARCDAPSTDEEGVVFGRVVDEDGRPVPHATVRVLWAAVRGTARPNMLRIGEDGFATEADEEGVFAVCGVPRDHALGVSASLGQRTSAPVDARIPEDGGVLAVEVALPEDAPSGAVAHEPPIRPAEVGPASDWLASKGFHLRTAGALLHQAGDELRAVRRDSIAAAIAQATRVEVARVGPGRNELRLHRSTTWSPNDPPDTWCVLDLFLNGNLVRQMAGGSELSPDRLLDPRIHQLTAIEVFDADEAPVAVPGGCGAALLWFYEMRNQDADFTGSLVGRVMRMPGAEPASGVLVTLQPGGVERRTDPQGYVDFGWLAPARYRIDTTVPGWGTWSAEVQLRAGERHEVAIEVEARAEHPR